MKREIEKTIRNNLCPICEDTIITDLSCPRCGLTCWKDRLGYLIIDKTHKDTINALKKLDKEIFDAELC